LHIAVKKWEVVRDEGEAVKEVKGGKEEEGGMEGGRKREGGMEESGRVGK